jgi:Putative bacterial sensory transduction regulator
MKLKWMLALSAGLALALAAGAAAAKPLPEGGMTVPDVVAWLQDNGLKAEVKKGSDGEEHVETSPDGLVLNIFLNDCKNGRCQSLEFWLSFDMKGKLAPDENAAAMKMQEWNRTKRWGRAYTDKSGDPVLDMDVSVSPGGTTEALDDTLGVYRDISREFKTFVGW